MIIRNPYNFVSKHYKIINLILLLPMLYLLFKFGDIAEFFRDFVKAGYSTPETNFADSYVTGLAFLVPFLMLIITGTLYIICATKKKKVIYYLASAFYYAILLLAALLFRSTMESIQRVAIDETFANFVRDCANLSVYPMYVLMVIGASKGLGFNFRTLRFDNNADLQIKEDDDENIELRIGSEDNSLKKNLVHLIRELKYYILENKFVFTCLSVVAGIGIVVMLFLNFQVYNKTYTVNQAFSMDNFTLSLKDSYITNVDYRGNEFEDGKYYLAVKIGIENRGKAAAIESSNFRIFAGNDELYPSYDRSAMFVDVGKPYTGQEIPRTDEEHPGEEFVFVYALTEKQVRSSYQMRILNGLTHKEGKLITRYKKINIKPTNITKLETMDPISSNKELSLKGSMLGDTKYQLNSLKVVTDYRYEIETCTNNVCSKTSDIVTPSNGGYLVVIEDDITWDENISYYKNSNTDFYEDYAMLSYQYNIFSGVNSGDNNYHVTALKNKTPKGLKDVKVYEVSSTMNKAIKINLLLRIRNRVYTIEVK